MILRRNYIYKLLGICGAFIYLLSSCSTKSTTDKNGAEVTVIKFDQASEKFKVAEAFKDISCVQLEMTEESVLGEIKKIIDVEEKLVILTKDNEIVVFNREDGKYIRHIGGAGEGPEEYIDAQDMFYNSSSGTIDIYDRMKNDIVSYKISGEFFGKKELPIFLPYVQSMERGADGSLLVCNQLAGGLSNKSDYAFTLITPDDKCENFDPFAPVTVDGLAFIYAKCPMSVCQDEMKYAGFLSDTISVIKDGSRMPLYKLDTENKFITKKTAGELEHDELFQYCLERNLLQGIDLMFETERYLILYPVMSGRYGYYWIDKKTNAGWHIPSDGTVDSEIRKVVQGELAVELIGYNENELISCFQDIELYKRIFSEAISDKRDTVVLPEKVVSAIENADPDGNPFLLIYSN